MSDRAQRVLDALMKYDAEYGIGYPIASIIRFFGDKNIASIIRLFGDKNIVAIDEDFEALTADEEKQVIQAFLKFAY